MSEASCLLCFLAYGLTTQHCPSRWHRALRQAQSPSRLNPGPTACTEGLCSIRTQEQGWLQLSPFSCTDRPQCTQLDILLGFTTDRWLPSQCLWPVSPSRAPGHGAAPATATAPSMENGTGPAWCWAAAPSSDSSNTGLSKQLSLSALAAAPKLCQQGPAAEHPLHTGS